MDVAEISRSLELLEIQLGRRDLSVRGEGPSPPSRERIFGDHNVLFQPEVADIIRENGSEELLRWFSRLTLARATASQDDTREEATPPIKHEGQEVPWPSVPLRIAEEQDRQRRESLARAWVEAAPPEDDPERVDRLRAATESMGGIDETVGRVSGVNPSDEARTAERFLQATRDLYRDNFHALIERQIGIPPHEATGADLAHLLFFLPWADSFPRGAALTTIRSFLQASGIDRGCRGRIRVDLSDHPEKAGTTVRWLGDGVGISVAGGAGPRFWAAVLGGLGRGMVLAQAHPDLSPDARLGYSHQVLEGRGLLLESLLGSGPWLRRVARLAGAAEFRRLPWVLWLARLRSRSAAILSHRDLFGGMTQSAWKEEGRERVRDALRINPPLPTRLRLELAGSLTAHRNALAWGDQLKENYDEDWFLNPRAGALLAELSERGADGGSHEPQLGSPLTLEALVTRFEVELQ